MNKSIRRSAVGDCASRCDGGGDGSNCEGLDCAKGSPDTAGHGAYLPGVGGVRQNGCGGFCTICRAATGAGKNGPGVDQGSAFIELVLVLGSPGYFTPGIGRSGIRDDPGWRNQAGDDVDH